ncbi:MAG TPA: hypothetical protein VJ817_01275 [Gemmatimonadales bacterium]|nr:hypothetical protein [Gemmatimonadales bacterium]
MTVSSVLSPASPNVASTSQVQGSNITITFVSDVTWSAQTVCVNALSPPNCPAGATLYGIGGAGAGWSADLSSIPGAAWIWGLGVTGATSPAYPAEYTFSKVFDLPGVPAASSISIAADDFAEVLVNGMSAGTVGSRTDASLAGAAQNALRSFDIRPYLVRGSNVIAVRAANGVFGCGAGPYSCNPAGIVFGGILRTADPGTLIAGLTDAVLALHLSPAGRENSLVVKLDAALSALGRDDVAATCGLLSAFINEVHAQTGGSIGSVDSDRLVAAAEDVSDLLECS